MSGHSHWAGIKYRKAAVDARKGKVFSKLARQIIIAARDGGADLETNIKLRYAVDKARAVSMPKDNIERAIKRGTGQLDGAQFEEVTYEGYGPGGIAIMVEALTDNKNRTSSEIRKIFDTRGGSLGATNCVAWLFETKGFFTLPADSISEDELMAIALDIGAENMELSGKTFEITCDPKDFESVKHGLSARNVSLERAEITKIPKSYIKLAQEEGRKILSLVDAIEGHDDVHNVYANFDVPDELLEERE